MRAIVLSLYLTVGLVPVALRSGEATPPQQKRKSIEERFKQLDRNGDGKISKDEAPRWRSFTEVDKSGDGIVTLEEARPYFQQRNAGQAANATSPIEPVTVQYAEAPKGVDPNQLSLDLYMPKGAKNDPVMVYIHGGGWQRGDKKAVGQKVAFFSGMGWGFVSINYRLLPAGKHPVNVQDVARALAWVHNHIGEKGGDPKKLFLMGHSAGAHLAALVATDDRHLKAVGKDLTILKGVIPLDTNAYDLPTLMKTRSTGLYGQVFGKDPKIWHDASPAVHVAEAKGIPPFLICYSRGMRTNPDPARKANAEGFAKLLRAAKIKTEVVDTSDRNHGEINARFGDPKDEKVTGKAKQFLHSLQ